MSSPGAPCYRFATPEQRRALFQSGFGERIVVDAASGTDAVEIPSGGAVAIAVAPDGHLVWMDERGRLFGSACESDPIELGAGSNPRLVTSRERLWVFTGGSLAQLDTTTFQILFQEDVQGLTDIAPDGAGGVWLLARTHIRRLADGASEPRPYSDLEEPASQIAAAGDALAALSKDAMRLIIRKPRSGADLVLDLKAVLGNDWPGKHPILASTGDGFLLAARSTDMFALIDRDGNLVVQGSWRDHNGPSLLTGSGHDDLIGLFQDDGRFLVKRFRGFARRGGKRILTPALDTDSPSGRWLSADVSATLPEGATLAVRWAATSDASVARTVGRVLDDQSLSKSERLRQADLLLPWSASFTYVGIARDPAVQGAMEPEHFTLPLHAADGPILWIDVQLRSNASEVEPEFHGLTVFHEAEGLMDRLPAIYRGDGDGDGTLRRLVGVLEATTQDLDRRIGRLAARLDPNDTDKKWLPDLAAMLGLPFHDGLPTEMARGIVSAAAPILAGRGTREGLLALLRAVFPGRPARVVDLTEQLIPIALDGATRLPALLSGQSCRVAKLNARLVLSKTALCPATACDETSIVAPPQVLVVIPATQRERRRYAEAIGALIHEMLPVGVRLHLRWTSSTRSRHAAAEDVLATVDAPEDLALGSGPALGWARTGGGRSARLDSSGVIPAEHRLL